MTRNTPKTLSRNFNIFGPKFEEWLSRMLPLSTGANLNQMSRDFRIIALNDMHRRAFTRLIALWTQMHDPRPAG